MTDKEKLKEIKKLADAMYYNAFNMTTDASLLLKAMQKYQQFIINYYNEESVSEDLEEVSKKYSSCTYLEEVLSDDDKEVLKERLINTFKAGAQWKEKEMQSTIEFAEDHAMFAGMEKMKEQMMTNAIVHEVKVDAGGYPYIDAIELYDYDKDIPLAKEGDKIKVIIIKED